MSFSQTKRIVLLVVVVSIGLAGIASHIYLGADREYATGALAVLDHIFDLILALTLTAILTAVGHAICERLRLKFFNAAEEISVSLFVGTGVVGLAVLFFGLAGWLRPVPIALLMIVCIVATRRSWMRLYEVITASIQNVTRTREAAVAATIYLGLIVFLCLRAATLPNAADELIYHLSVTNDFVQRGQVYPMFDNALGNLPFLIHMTYTLCLLAGSDIAARLLSLFLAVGTSFAIFGFCSRYSSKRIGAVAMFAFFGAGMVVEVAVTSRIDVSLAGMLFLCTYAMVNYLDTDRREWLWVSALFAGFSLGIKHTAFIWLGLIGLMYLVEQLVKRRSSMAAIFGRGLAYTLLAIAIASPWYIKNYVWFHNPVYPLLTGEVAEFGPQGVRYFDANDEQKLDAYFNIVRSELPEVVKAQEKELTDAINSRVQRHPLRWWEFFLKPNTYLMSEPNHYPNYLFLVIPLLVFLRKPKWIMWLLALSLGFVFALTWTSWIARYLLPAYPALTIVASYVVTSLSESLKQWVSSLEKLHVYAVAVVLGVVVAGGVQLMKKFNSWSYLSGKVSRHEIVSGLTYYQPIQFINSRLPPDARIFVVGVQLTHGIEREHLSDESWFTTKWRRVLVRNTSFEEVNEDLKRQGFTHIFYSANLFKFAAAMGTQGTGGMELISSYKQAMSEEARRLGPEYQLLRNWSTFTLYKRNFLETLYSVDGYEVLRIK
jgi:4-amino-4-deoxy-L-arabinose transferase-like glycosyltransferase